VSASNWAKCPRCTARAKKKQEEAMAALAEAGLDDGTFSLTVSPAGDSFREDYEIYGAEDGEVTVSYGGRCTECGLSLNFTHKHVITGWDE
jgi:Fe-S cluster biogenesis protein NfuA